MCGARRIRKANSPQFLGKIRGGGLTVSHLLRESFQTSLFEFRRDIEPNLTWRLGLVVAHLPQELLGIHSAKWLQSANHLIKNHTQTINIGATIDSMCLSCELLRRHVRHRAAHDTNFTSARSRFIKAQSEVDNNRSAIGRQNNVRRFDVSVDDQSGVRMREGVGHCGHDSNYFVPTRAVSFEPLREARPFKKFGYDIDLPVVPTNVVDGDDAAVIQPRQPASFMQELLRLAEPHISLITQNFDRNRSIELRVVAKINRPKSADTQQSAHLVTAERIGE